MYRTHPAAARAGITLDAGALITLDRGDRRLIALLERVLAQRLQLRVPSGVVGQVWRNGRIQVTLAQFLRIDELEIVPLEDRLARSCGELCGATETADIIDASVVIFAKAARRPYCHERSARP